MFRVLGCNAHVHLHDLLPSSYWLKKQTAQAAEKKALREATIMNRQHVTETICVFQQQKKNSQRHDVTHKVMLCVNNLLSHTCIHTTETHHRKPFLQIKHLLSHWLTATKEKGTQCSITRPLRSFV